MSVCGAGYALVWLERERGLRACRCDPLDCFAVRGAAAGSPLLGAVRLFRDAEGGTGGVLYEKDALRPFTWDGQRARLAGPEDNPLHALPLVPFANNCQGTNNIIDSTKNPRPQRLRRAGMPFFRATTKRSARPFRRNGRGRRRPP